MENYKELYLKMMRATEKSIRILIDAQRDCEEALLREEEETRLLCFPGSTGVGESEKPEENQPPEHL